MNSLLFFLRSKHQYNALHQSGPISIVHTFINLLEPKSLAMVVAVTVCRLSTPE